MEPASKLGKQPVIKTNLEPVQENDKSEGRKQNKVNRKQRIMPRFTLQHYLWAINVDFLAKTLFLEICVDCVDLSEQNFFPNKSNFLDFWRCDLSL